jgi:hypothetical protein
LLDAGELLVSYLPVRRHLDRIDAGEVPVVGASVGNGTIGGIML